MAVRNNVHTWSLVPNIDLRLQNEVEKMGTSIVVYGQRICSLNLGSHLAVSIISLSEIKKLNKDSELY